MINLGTKTLVGLLGLLRFSCLLRLRGLGVGLGLSLERDLALAFADVTSTVDSTTRPDRFEF